MPELCILGPLGLLKFETCRGRGDLGFASLSLGSAVCLGIQHMSHICEKSMIGNNNTNNNNNE